MSNPYHSRVQQKLSHCRMALQWLASSDGLGRQGEEALLQGALVHVAVACRLYLREVGYALSVKNPERIFQVQDLVDVVPNGAGVEELRGQAWVTSLFAAERDVLNPPLATSALQLIAADTAVTQGVELTLERLRYFLTALSELVDRQRQSFEEY